jgi:hypothetical protein
MVTNEMREIAAIEWLIETIAHMRRRPSMYLDPIDPHQLETFLGGLRTGLQAFGLVWNSMNHRQAVVEARGIEYSAAQWETHELRSRGLSACEIVDELLAIELEMWQAHRADLITAR